MRSSDQLALVDRRQNWPWLKPFLLFLVLGCLCLAVDLSVAQWMLAHRKVASNIKYFEAFAHGTGVYTIFLVMWILDPQRRKFMPRIWAMCLVPGAIAYLVKLSVWRLRPHSFDFEGGVFSTFVGFFSGFEIESTIQSFPSSHTLQALMLAVGLSWLYPRGRVIFGILAFLGGLQRVAAGAHFMSDACFGAALGWGVGVALLRMQASKHRPWRWLGP